MGDVSVDLGLTINPVVVSVTPVQSEGASPEITVSVTEVSVANAPVQLTAQIVTAPQVVAIDVNTAWSQDYLRAGISTGFVYRGAEGWRIDRWARPVGGASKATANTNTNPGYANLEVAWAARETLVYA